MPVTPGGLERTFVGSDRRAAARLGVTELMNPNELRSIADNPAASPEDRERARTALGASEPWALHPDTHRMLDALKLKSVADLSSEIYERYCLTYYPRPSDWIVREVTYWLPPDESFLDIMGFSLNDWWLQIHRDAKSARRADVESYALRKLQGN
jgi:hypothetical protein